MTKPRLSLRPLSLPVAPKRYDPNHMEAMQRLVEQQLSHVQPVQERQEVTGSRGANDALASLITALATLGFITDSTTV